jgi:hypothetical protein
MKKYKIMSITLIAAVISIAVFSGHTFAETGKMIRIATVTAGADVTGLTVNNLGNYFSIHNIQMEKVR